MYNFFPDNYIWTIRTNALINEIPLGGGRWGEIFPVIQKLNTKEPDSWVRAWEGLADEVRGQGENAEAKGLTQVARDCYLRASNYYLKAEIFLKVHNQKKMDLYKKSLECFHRGIKWIPNVEAVKIPYENSYLPGYFVNASRQGEKRPLLVALNGLDGTSEKLFFSFGRSWPEYGLSALLVEGPGSGGALRLNGIKARYDYEVPAKAIFDYLETRIDVDEKRVALQGWSLAGYFAPRAVAFEKRYAACIVYGALFDYAEIWANRPDDYPLALHLMWILGVDNMTAAREKLKNWNLRKVAPLVECPTLILHGENDQQSPLSDAYRTYEALRCPKELKIFSKESGGDQHCQLNNLQLAQEEIFGWLTRTLSSTSS